MHTQLTLDLVTKLPLSAVPRLGGKTKPIKQTEIQAEGCFKLGDPHPLYEGLIFRGKRKGRGQRWFTKEEHEAEKLKARDYEKKNKHVRQAYNERNAERISKKSAQYYKDNWDAKNEYRKKHRERTRANVNRNYANNKAPYIAKRNARRKHLKENIKLTKTQRAELNELHRLRLELDLAAVGAGMFPEGHNKQGRWAFEVHHLMPLTENKEVYLGLDAAWNVEILSVADHKKAHSYVSPSEC